MAENIKIDTVVGESGGSNVICESQIVDSYVKKEWK